jgi:hypothetical protein
VLARRAVESAEKADEKEVGALYEAEAAVREALVGNMNLARQQAQKAFGLSNGRDVEAWSATALEMAGDSTQAERLSEDLKKRFPEDTIVQFNYLPAIYATSLLHASDAGKATEALASPSAYELGGNYETLSFVFYPIYLRGNAYLVAKKGVAAASEFQKILDHPGAVRSDPIGALAHLERARALALSGDEAKTKAAYEEFLTIWKDADPDIPIFKQAKAEYIQLH